MTSFQTARNRAILTGGDPDDAERCALAKACRAERNALLGKADAAINALIDSSADTSPWRAYRQALRDVPQQPGFPESIKWPKAPAK